MNIEQVTPRCEQKPTQVHKQFCCCPACRQILLTQFTNNLFTGFQVLKPRHTRGLTLESHSSNVCNCPL
jgi:hypothetical protein